MVISGIESLLALWMSSVGHFAVVVVVVVAAVAACHVV